MKETILMDEDQLIKRAIAVLMHELGPVETFRFLAIEREKPKDYVKRHREWQATLNKDELFDKVFGTK